MARTALVDEERIFKIKTACANKELQALEAGP
jgi:hypothetical protein